MLTSRLLTKIEKENDVDVEHKDDRENNKTLRFCLTVQRL